MQSCRNPSGAFLLADCLAAAQELCFTPNTFYVEAFDTSNNRSMVSGEVVRDSLAPVIRVTTPGDGASVHETPIPLKGSVSDANLADFSINGVNVVLGGGLFATTAELSSGENKFILRARDLAGNTTEIERTVTLIGQAPTVTFVSPKNGFTFKHSPIPVTVTAESTDGTTIQSVINDQAVGPNSALISLVHGVNTLTAVATAGSGAKRTVSIQVEYQDPLQPPLEVVVVSSQTPTLGMRRPTMARSGFASGGRLASRCRPRETSTSLPSSRSW